MPAVVNKDYIVLCGADASWVFGSSGQRAGEQDDCGERSDGNCSELVPCVKWESQQTAGDGPRNEAGSGNVTHHTAIACQSKQFVDGNITLSHLFVTYQTMMFNTCRTSYYSVTITAFVMVCMPHHRS